MPPTLSPMPSDSVPATTKVLAVVVLIVVLGGLYYWYTSSKAPAPTPVAPAPVTSGDNRPASVAAQAPVQAQAPIADTDTSDAALVKDSAAIDAQLTGLSSDTSSLGAVDQTIPQAY
jgi:hypothetical protein